MTNTPTYQIGELAKAADVTPRTIRFYTSEGLLSPPRMDGRVAVYSEEHLRRLKLIARLKAAFLPLSEIRARLREMTEEELETLAEASPAEPARGSATSAGSEGAAGYVRRLLAEREGLRRPDSQPLFALMQSPPPVRGAAGPAAAVSGEAWERIALAPGIELHVRLPLSPAAREFVEEVMEQSRRFLAPG